MLRECDIAEIQKRFDDLEDFAVANDCDVATKSVIDGRRLIDELDRLRRLLTAGGWKE